MDFDFNSVKKNDITNKTSLNSESLYIDLIRDEILPVLFDSGISSIKYTNIISSSYTIDENWIIKFNNGLFECYQEVILDNQKILSELGLDLCNYLNCESVFTRFSKNISETKIKEIYKNYDFLLKKIKILSPFKYTPFSRDVNRFGEFSYAYLINKFGGFSDAYLYYVNENYYLDHIEIPSVIETIHITGIPKYSMIVDSKIFIYNNSFNSFAMLFYDEERLSSISRRVRINSKEIVLDFTKNKDINHSIIPSFMYGSPKNCARAISNFCRYFEINKSVNISIHLHKDFLKNIDFDDNQIKEFVELCCRIRKNILLHII